MTDHRPSSSLAIGLDDSLAERVAAEDLDCLQSALADWERDRAALLARSHALEADTKGKLQHLELQLHQAISELEASKRKTHAVRVRLEADLQRSQARTQHTQEALAASQEVSEQLRVTNAELSTAMEAAQWRLGELEAENGTLRESLLVMEQQRHADLQRLVDVEKALLTQQQVAAEETARGAELNASLGALQARTAGLEHTIHQLQAERAQLAAALEHDADLQRQLADLRAAQEAATAAHATALTTLRAELEIRQHAHAEALEALAQARAAHAQELPIWQDRVEQQQADLAAADKERLALAARVDELDAEIHATRERSQNRSDQVAAANAECLRIETHYQSEQATLHSTLQSLEQTLRERDTTIHRLQEFEAQLERAQTAHAHQLQQSATREAELLATGDALMLRLVDEQAQTRRARDDADSLTARLHDVGAALEAAHARRVEHADEQRRSQEQIAQLTSHRDTLADRTQLLEHELQQREVSIEELRSEIAQLDARHAQARQAADDAARRITGEANVAIGALQDELDSARRALTEAESATMAAQQHCRDMEALAEERAGELHGAAEAAAALAQENAAAHVALEQRIAELDAQRTELTQQLDGRQTQSVLAHHRYEAMAAQMAEFESERSALTLRIDELNALTVQLERECDRLRRDRGSSEETRRLKADSARLEAKIVELDRQRSEAVQRHSAAVAGYMVELNQRSEALHAREVELHKLTEELALVKQGCEDAVGELSAARRQREALERELAELRTTPARSVASTAAEPGRPATPTPLRPSASSAAPRVSPTPAKSAKRPSPSEAITGPVTVIHLEESKTLCEAARDVVARVPDAVYMSALDTAAPNARGSRLLAVNLLSRAHDPVEAITAFIAVDTYHRNVLAYCAEGSSGFLFGMADFFTQPVDPDACLARLLESRGAIQRLLVATENFAAVGALRDVLSRMRSSVSAALDLRQVFDLLPMVEPDVLLVDLGLPRGEGLRLVSRLRCDPKTKDLALGILLAPTGNAAEFRQHALRAARDLPMAAADLAEALSRRLGARAPASAPARSLQTAGALA